MIGAEKCGTSSLHYYLGLHPQIAMSRPKELNFFAEGWNWERGVDWYERHFPTDAPVRGETSPIYTFPWIEGVAARMVSVVPDARLVFIARDPVDRMVSQYEETVNIGQEPHAPAEALCEPNSLYLQASSYHRALAPFIAAFPAERFFVTSQEALLARRGDTLRALFRFLGVHEGFFSPKFERMQNRSAEKGWRYRAILRLTPLSSRLPPEAKWKLRRLVFREPARPQRPDLDAATRQELRRRLRPDLERFARWLPSVSHSGIAELVPRWMEGARNASDEDRAR